LDLNNLTAGISLNIQNFVNQMNRVSQTVQNMSSRLNNSFGPGAQGHINATSRSAQQLNRDFKDMERIVGGILISQMFYNATNQIQTASGAMLGFMNDMEKAQISMEYFLGGNEQAAQGFIMNMKDFSAETAFNTQQALNLSKKLLNARFEAGQIRGIMERLNDASAVAGMTPETIDRIVLAMTQLKTNGKIMGTELRQLAEANIPAYRILAEQLGMTGEEVLNIGELKIDGDVGVAAILEGLKEFEGAAERVANTVPGMWETIKDNMLIIGEQMFAGPYKALEKFLRRWRDGMETLRSILTEKGLGGVFEKLIPPELQESVRAILGSFMSLGQSAMMLYQAFQPVVQIIAGVFTNAMAVVLPMIAAVARGIAMTAAWALNASPAIQYFVAAIGTIMVAMAAARALMFLWSVMRFGVLALVVGKAVVFLAQALRLLTLMLIRNPIVAAIMLVVGTLAYLAAGSAAATQWIDALIGRLSALGGVDTGKLLQPKDQKSFEEWTNAFNKSLDDMQKKVKDAKTAIGGPGGIGDKTKDAGKEAGKAKKKIEKFVAAFDELYQIPEKLDEANSGIGDLGDGLGDLGKDLDVGGDIKMPDYDFQIPQFPMPEIPEEIPTPPIPPGPGAPGGPPLWDAPWKNWDLREFYGWMFGIGNAIAGVGAAIAGATGWIVDAIGKVINWGKAVWNQFTILGTQLGTWFTETLEQLTVWAVNGALAISNWAINTGVTIGNWVMNTGIAIGNWAMNTAISFGNWATNTWTTITTWATNTWTSFTTWISNVDTALGTWFLTNAIDFGIWADDTWQTIKDWASNTGIEIGKWIVEHAVAFKKWIDDNHDDFDNWKDGNVTRIEDWKKETEEKVKTWAAITAGNFATWVSTTSKNFQTWKTNTTSNFQVWGTVAGAAIAAWAIASSTNIGNWTSATSKNIGKWAGNAGANIATWANNAVNSTSKFATNAATNIANWGNTTGKGIAKWAISAGGAMVSFGKAALGAVNGFASASHGTFGSWLNGTSSGIYSWARSALSAINSFAKSAWESIKKLGQSIGEAMGGSFKGVSTTISKISASMGGFAARNANWIVPSVAAAAVLGAGVATVATGGAAAPALMAAMVAAPVAIKSMPGYETGTIVDYEHIARVGEGGKKEAIIPLENSTYMKPFSSAVANDLFGMFGEMMGGQSQDDRPILYVGTLIADDRSLRELDQRMKVVRLNAGGSGRQ
jgi:tape measure domain-containing protein